MKVVANAPVRRFEERRRIMLRNEQGVSTLEFTFLLPFLFFVVFGIVELCRASLTLSLLQTAVRDGAHTGALTPVANDPKAAARQRVQEVLASGGVIADTPPDPQCRTDALVPSSEPCTSDSRQVVWVQASVTFRTVIPLLLPSMSEFVLSREAVVHREAD